MRKSSKFLGAIAVAGLVAAGASAYTASNTVPDSVAGYGSAEVTGATATSIEHTLGATGATIVSSKIVFDAPQTGNTVSAAFGAGALENCDVDGLTATCDWATAIDTASAELFVVTVVATPTPEV